MQPAEQQGVYKSSLTDFQQISRRYPGYIFLKFQMIFMWQAIQYQNTGEVCIVWGPPIFSTDIYRAGMLTPEIIVILYTGGLPYVHTHTAI